jgi:hypothetical protein
MDKARGDGYNDAIKKNREAYAEKHGNGTCLSFP